MNKRWGFREGFTIVELLIVIVIIAILAAISVVAYNGIQARANDSKMRAGINQFEKALRIWVQDHPPPIIGGVNSTVVANNGVCTDGANGFLARQGAGLYICTVDDALMNAGNLPSGFLLGLPRNTYYPATLASNGRYSTMFYYCGAASLNRYVIYWTLQNPTTEEGTNLDNALTTCGHNATNIRDTYGMRAAKILQF